MPKISLILVLFCVIVTVSAGTPTSVDDIRESVFRHQIGRWNATTYYLAFGIDRRGEFVGPPSQFMQRFSGQPEVKKYPERLVLKESEVILCIDNVKIKENTAEVSARFVPFELTKSSAGFYNLSFEKNGKWKVTGTSRFKVIPLEH